MRNLLFTLLLFIGYTLSAQSDKIPAFSLLGKSEQEIIELLGKPKKILSEHNGNIQLATKLFISKNGEYRIIFEDGYVDKVFIKPTVKQRFNEHELFDGGLFDVEIPYSGIGGSENGRNGDRSYYTIFYDCDNGKHKMTFYGKKGGIVSEIGIY